MKPLRNNPLYDYLFGGFPNFDNVEGIGHDTLIDRKLDAISIQASVPPAWMDAWQNSKRGRKSMSTRPAGEAGREERLIVWKAVRESGDLPKEATFYMIAGQIAFLTEVEVVEEMVRLDKATEELWATIGFAEWRNEAGRPSTIYLDFLDRNPVEWDRRYVRMLHCHGEIEIARLYKEDRELFEERFSRGQAFFLPPKLNVLAEGMPSSEVVQPGMEWVDIFIEHLYDEDCICLADSEHPVSVRYRIGEREGETEIRVNINPGEIIGGPRDGEKVFRTFFFDVGKLTHVFEEIVEVQWFPFGSESGVLVPHIRVSGVYQGHRLALYFLSQPIDEPESHDSFEMTLQ